jgi:hypothetical protein
MFDMISSLIGKGPAGGQWRGDMRRSHGWRRVPGFQGGPQIEKFL